MAGAPLRALPDIDPFPPEVVPSLLVRSLQALPIELAT
jgi:hypothetical protein